MLLFYILQYAITYSEKTYISVFENTNNFYIESPKNKYYYRESILPIFVLDFKNNDYISSEEPIYNTFGQIYYSNNNLKNIVIKDEWSLIDSVSITIYREDFIHIVSSTFGIDNYTKIQYRLYVNNRIIDSSYTNNYRYFKDIYITEGYHNISLWGKYKQNNNICICPSINKGFTMGYQLAIWETDYENIYSKYNHYPKVDLEIKQYHIKNNDTEDIISDTNHYETNYLSSILNYNKIHIL